MEIDRAGPETPHLLILGASARAAAMSAVRSGYQPTCGDLFADADLREIATIRRVTDYPAGLIDVAEHVPPGDWMYVGALENHPRIVERISARHRLLGNPPEVLRAVRDPVRVAGVLRNRGFPALEVRTAGNPPVDGVWLRKPLKSAAGHGIHVVKPGCEALSPGNPTSPPAAAHYYQRHGAGEAISATFVASAEKTVCVGVTRQLVGVAEWNAGPFAYCGSIGPLRLPEETQVTVEQLGRTLADEFRLQGLFGLDLQWDGEDVLLTEVNPRYTAAVEVLEWATGRRLIAEHAVACGNAAAGGGAALQYEFDRVVGKAIVLAERVCRVGPFPRAWAGDGVPTIADRPAEGTTVRPGEPICTVLAVEPTFEACRAVLAERVRMVRGCLRPECADG